MTTLEMLIDVLSRSRERFDRAFDGVTLEQANTRPAPDLAPRIDSLTWLAWHTAREQDLQIAALAGTSEVWTSQGWVDRFNLDLPRNSMGYGHTPEEAARVHVTDLSLLLGYLDQATEATIAYVRSLTPDVLNDVIDTRWTPHVTRGVRVVSIIDDAAQHAGQAAYIQGMLG